MAQTEGFPSQSDEQAWASQSPDLIRFKQFQMTRRGYDPDEVREYLAQVATWFEEAKQYLVRLEREQRELRAQREALMQSKASGEGDPYQELAVRMADVLRAVDHHAQTLRHEVDEEARTRTEQAERDADQIRADAEAEAGQVRQEAERFAKEVRGRAEELLGRLTSHRMAVRDELQGILERTKHLASQLGQQIGTLEGGMRAGEGGDEAAAASEARERLGEPDAQLSYASDDLLIVLPDLVPTVDQEDERS
jgi:DivIVA domain-containing protein